MLEHCQINSEILQNFTITFTLFHNTRGSQHLHIIACKINLQKKSVINMGIRLYNKLPKYIQQEERYKSYKRKMKGFLIDNAFYSLDEYLNYEDM